MNLETSDSPSYYEYLSIEDSKFKWRADLRKLKDFIESELKLTGKWSSPGGDLKRFSGQQVSIKWSQGKKVLQIQGDDCEKVKQQMYDGILGFLPLDQTNKTSEVEVTKTAIAIDEGSVLHKDTNEDTGKWPQEDELIALKTRLDSLVIEVEADKHQTNNKISDLYARLNVSQPVENSSAELSRLREENEELRKENNTLIERVNNLSYILADLKTKADNAEEEKASLITAIRILQSDATQASTLHIANNAGEKDGTKSSDDGVINNQSHQPEKVAVTAATPHNEHGYQIQSDSWQTAPTTDKNSQERKRVMKTPLNIINHTETFNRYEVLSENEDNNYCEVSEESLLGQQHEPPQNYSQKHLPPNSDIVIIGDSIIKNIQPRKLTKKKVYKYTFPGKTAEEITEQANSLDAQISPSHTIIHAGTNNLPIESAGLCASRIESLAVGVQAKFPQSKIGLSSITLRQDIDVARKIQEVNEKLKQICTKHGFTYIDNSAINSTGLNGSKLHLNTKGSSFLAVQFIKFLQGDRKVLSPNKQNFPYAIIQQLRDLLMMMSSRSDRKTQRQSTRTR